MRQSAWLQARNAFELLSRLPNHGVGSKLSRTTWSDNCFWTVAKVRLSTDGKHGKAWGVLTWRGKQQEAERLKELPGPLKPRWRVLAGGQQQQEQQQAWQSLLAQTLQQERQQAEAAWAAEEGETPAEGAADAAAAAQA